jgi:maltooligosyltrehalose synthase
VPLGRQGAWEDTALQLPDNSPAAWRNVFTGETLLATESSDGKKCLYLKNLVVDFPVALLERSSMAPADAATFLPLEERLH